jgi:hypothetical protein
MSATGSVTFRSYVQRSARPAYEAGFPYGTARTVFVADAIVSELQAQSGPRTFSGITVRFQDLPPAAA